MENKILILIVDIITFIGTILLLISCCIIYSNISSVQYEYLHYFGNNWKFGPVSSIDANSNLKCPINSQLLLDSAFTGTYPGCNCNGTVTKNACTIMQYDEKCVDINATPSMVYKGWGDSTLCGSRMAQNYLDLASKNINETCYKDFKQCGIIDTYNNKLCLNQTDPCPINYIKIININESVPQDFNYNVKELTSINKKIIYTNENTNGSILTQFMISETTPCADPVEMNFSNKSRYILDPVIDKSNCSPINNITFDSQYKLLDQMNYKELIKENGIFNLLLSLPSFSENYVDFQVELFSKPYIGVNTTCIKLANELYPKPNNLIAKLLKTYQTFENSQANPIASGAVGFIVYFVIFFFLMLKMAFYIYYDMKVFKVVRMYLNASISFFMLLLFITGLVACIKISTLRNIYVWLSSEKTCTDDISFSLINKFDSKLALAYCAVVIFTISCLIFLNLPLTEYIIANLSDSQHKENNQEIMANGENRINLDHSNTVDVLLNDEENK